MALIVPDDYNNNSQSRFNDECIDFCTISPNNMDVLLDFLQEENWKVESKIVSFRNTIKERVTKEWNILIKNENDKNKGLYLFILPAGRDSVTEHALRDLYIQSMHIDTFNGLKSQGMEFTKVIKTFPKINKDKIHMMYISEENKCICEMYSGKTLIVRCVPDEQNEKETSKELFFLKHERYRLNNQISHAMECIITLNKHVYELNTYITKLQHPEPLPQDLKLRCDWQELHIRTLEKRLSDVISRIDQQEQETTENQFRSKSVEMPLHQPIFGEQTSLNRNMFTMGKYVSIPPRFREQISSPKILSMTESPLRYFDIIGTMDKIELFDNTPFIVKQNLEEVILHKTVYMTIKETDPLMQYTFLFIPCLTQHFSRNNDIYMEVLFVENGLMNFRDEQRDDIRICTFSVLKDKWLAFKEDSDYVVLNTRPFLYREGLSVFGRPMW